ncbi:glycosyltransferase family 4 protein [Lutibacter sp.]|uniref:glycosyltransferase family 4 protein n=1 Tax=Lutibacter sp. TaxID=1925666 RepID=UPI002736F368|nr:glycosyltransferase family 4 protein [Lutibacter sp.]
MKKKKILYIGTNLSSKSKYTSSMATLSEMLHLEGYEITKSSSKPNKYLRFLAMLWSVFKMRNSIDYVLIDTFSTSNFYYAVATSQLARLCSLKYIPILRGGNLPYRLAAFPKLSALLFQHSYKNIAPSKYMQYAFKERGFESDYIPNSIPIEKYDFKLRDEVKPKILWVRAFDQTYNPVLAIKVLSLLKNTFEAIELCMVGPDKDGSLSEAKLMAQQLNVLNSVSFTGVLPNDQWHLLSKKYDIFINTTNVDNMPVSILEAMALGFPIVSTNAGGLPYLIEDGIDGILVPVNDERAMANAIKDLIHNPEKATFLSGNARKKATEFDMNHVKRQWLDLLK